MDDKNNINNEIIEESKKNDELENNINNEKEEKEIKTQDKNLEIKKPVISEAEYQNMIKKRNLMTKNSKIKPIKLLFGKKKQPLNLNNSVNNNNQLNNYKTYLTTTETIKEEKYQKDGKTLIIENPLNNSAKYFNYKYKNEQLNKIMVIFIKKINEIEDIFHFSDEYLSFIINIFYKLCQPYITFLSKLFINRIKPNLKYFQNMIPIYKDFSQQFKMLELNNKIISNDKVDMNLINSVKKINLANADCLNDISNNLQNIILNNPLYIQIDTIETKYIDILSKMKLYINKLIKRKNKFNSYYQKKIEPYFNGIKERLNSFTYFYDFLTSNMDFLFIEYHFILKVNKIYSKISHFLINMSLLFKLSHNIFCDYLGLLNNLVKSFYNDNKNVFNMNSFLPQKLILNLDNIIKSNNIRKIVEKRFRFNKVIENCINDKTINDINHFLLNYRDNLIQYNYVKSEEIDEIINFNLIKYNTSDDFIQFLMRLIPKNFIFKFNELIEIQMDIKKNSGLLKGYTNSLLIITYQGHILIFDKEKKIEKNKQEEQEFNSIKRKSRKEIIDSILDEDDKKEQIKNNEKTDNSEVYEAISNNKITDLYIRKNFGLSKLASSPNKKLMQFYENILNYRQYKIIVVDLLSEDNMNKLINTISKNKFV